MLLLLMKFTASCVGPAFIVGGEKLRMHVLPASLRKKKCLEGTAFPPLNEIGFKMIARH